MKKLLILILLIPSFMGAQNSDLINQKNQKLPDLSEITPTSISKWISPNQYLKSGLRAFSSSTTGFHTLKFENALMPFWQDIWQTHEEMEPVKEAFFKNKDFWEPLYQTAMPLYKERLSNLPVAAAEKVMDMLEGGLEYVKNFDLAKEKAYVEELAKRPNPYLNKFTAKRGKMNAFIYRRIANQEMSKKEVIKWMERIVKDFKAALPKSSAEVDNYIIFKGLFHSSKAQENDYYWAYPYKHDKEEQYRNRYSSSLKHVLFKKEGETYSPVAPLSDAFEPNFSSKQSRAVTLNKKDGTKGLYFFRRDEGQGETTMQIFETDKAIQSISEFSSFDAIKLVKEDGSMDILYNWKKKQADVYSVSAPTSGLVEFEAIQRYFVLSEKGQGQLLRFAGEKEQLKISLEASLPKGITAVEKIELTVGKGIQKAEENHYFKLKSKGASHLWVLNDKTKKWEKTSLAINDFKTIERLKNGDYLFTNHNKLGLLSGAGALLLEPKYSEIYLIKNNFLALLNDETAKAAFFDAKGKALTEFKYNLIWKTRFDLNTFETSQSRLINEEAGTVICRVGQQTANGQFMVYNHKGEALTAATAYEYVSEAYTDDKGTAYYIVSKELKKNPNSEVPLGEYGVINSLGEEVIPLAYKQMRFTEVMSVFDPKTSKEHNLVKLHFTAKDEKGNSFFFNLKGEKIKNPAELKN